MTKTHGVCLFKFFSSCRELGQCAHAFTAKPKLDGGLAPRIRFKNQRKSAGGPREGSGGAVTAAICAAAMGCRAWASGEGCVNAVLSAGGGAEIEAHKGQSKVWLEAATSSSPCTTSFMLPVLVHTMSIPWGFTIGEAIATPTDNANHTNTRRVSWKALRRGCMSKF